MITTAEEDRGRERARLAVSLAASAIVNLLAWIGVAWSSHVHLPLIVKPPQPEEFVVSSTSIRMDRRPVPQPQRPAHPAEPQPEPRPVPRAHVAPPPAAHHEIARITPTGTPVPRAAREHPPTLQEQLAHQEDAFAREAKRLSESNAPLSIATIAPRAPAAYHRAYIDESGQRNQERVEALLQPVQHWVANGQSCYYVHYSAQFAGGGNEDGNIPWPVCYPSAHDAMLPLDRPHLLPVPAPPVGYVLPAGTPLGPLLREIYTGEIHN